MKGNYRKILIIKPSSLGDVVHSLPFLNAVSRRFPEAEIHWVIARGLEGLLEGHPMIRRLVIIDKDSWKQLSRAGYTVGEMLRLAVDLRSQRYDLAVDLQGLLRSGLITMMTGAPLRVGFSEAREGSASFYNRRIEGGRDIHAVDRYLKIAAWLGCDTSEVVFPFPPTDMKSRSDIAEQLPGVYAVMVPGARWVTKRWPAENFGRVASMLPLPSLVVGGVGDIPIADKVVEASQGKARSLAGRTDLRGLMEVMRKARVVISNDSGPMHIAAGFKVPVVAIFGPTSPVRTGPYGTGHIIIQSPEKCAPCYKKRCDAVCMERIDAAEVYSHMRPLLDSFQS